MEDKKVKMIFIIMFFVTSCSSLWSRRGVNVEDQTSGLKVVSKEQFDELAKKYQDLVDFTKKQSDMRDANKAVVEVKESKDPKDTVETVQVKPEQTGATNLDPSELVNHLDKAIQDAPATVGVDALNEERKNGPPVPTSLGVQQVNHTEDIDEQIVQLRDAATLVKVNKFENALAILKDLETSKEKQIVVRAKLMLGDLLFQQGEFDLAMQSYEDIIKNYAFSGMIIKALGKLVACSEKLKQPEKQAKYYSLLHDFFEAV
jgi:TolA-binding protein